MTKDVFCFKMNTDQVAVDRKRDTDERILADAQAKLYAAGGATNETALAAMIQQRAIRFLSKSVLFFWIASCG